MGRYFMAETLYLVSTLRSLGQKLITASVFTVAHEPFYVAASDELATPAYSLFAGS